MAEVMMSCALENSFMRTWSNSERDSRPTGGVRCEGIIMHTTKGSQMYIVYVMPPTPGEATGA